MAWVRLRNLSMGLHVEAMLVGGDVAQLSLMGSSRTEVSVWEEEDVVQRGTEQATELLS